MKQANKALFFGVEVNEEIALSIQSELKNLYLNQEGGVFLCHHEKGWFLGKEIIDPSAEEIDLLKEHITSLLPYLMEDPSHLTTFKLFLR